MTQGIPPFFIAGANPRIVATTALEISDGSQASSSEDQTPPTQPYEADPAPPFFNPREVEGDGFVFPEMRSPPVSLNHDTAYFNAGSLSPRSVHAVPALFVEEQYVLARHVMRYIDCGRYGAMSKVVAITRKGKHIVWQQAIRSCVPAAISMLALDRGKVFLAEEITYPVTNNEVQTKYIRKAGFEPKSYPLQGGFFVKVTQLEQILRQTGPGLLHLMHPTLESHMVVLDEISVSKWCATIREPYHGNMLTVKLYHFMEWIGQEFIELCNPIKSSL